MHALRLPGTLQSLLDSCETACVVECCDLEAFEFTEKNYRTWLAAHPGRRETLLEELDEFLRAIGDRPKVWVSSDRINFEWPRKKARAFFTDLRTALEGIR